MNFRQPVVPRFLVVLLWAMFWMNASEIVCGSILIWLWPR